MVFDISKYSHLVEDHNRISQAINVINFKIRQIELGHHDKFETKMVMEHIVNDGIIELDDLVTFTEKCKSSLEKHNGFITIDPTWIPDQWDPHDGYTEVTIQCYVDIPIESDSEEQLRVYQERLANCQEELADVEAKLLGEKK